MLSEIECPEDTRKKRNMLWQCVRGQCKFVSDAQQEGGAGRREADLQKLPFVQILPDILHNLGSDLKDAAHMVMVHNAIQVPLPVSCLLCIHQEDVLRVLRRFNRLNTVNTGISTCLTVHASCTHTSAVQPIDHKLSIFTGTMHACQNCLPSLMNHASDRQLSMQGGLITANSACVLAACRHMALCMLEARDTMTQMIPVHGELPNCLCILQECDACRQQQWQTSHLIVQAVLREHVQAGRQHNEAGGEDTELAPLGLARVSLHPYQVAPPDCIVHIAKSLLVQARGPAKSYGMKVGRGFDKTCSLWRFLALGTGQQEQEG